MMKKTLKLTTVLLGTTLLFAQPVLAAGNGDALNSFTGFGQEANQILAPQGILPYGEDVVALDDLGISISAADYTAIRQEDGFVYVYTDTEGSMPYVIIGRYDIASDGFTDAFSAYMAGSYADLRISEAAAPYTIGGNTFSRIVYEYTVSGYTVTDTRMFYGWNNYTYMFGTKEVPALGYFVGSGVLEQIAASMAPLAGGDDDYARHVDSNRSVTGGAAQGMDLGGRSGSMGDDFFEGSDVSTEAGYADDTVNGLDSIQAADADVAGTILFDESVADYEGKWLTFDDGFKLYMPAAWTQYPLTTEDQNNGALFLAYDASGLTDNPAYIEVDWAETQGESSLDDLASLIEMSGYTVDDKISVNGIPCVAYGSRESDLSALMFYHPLTTDYVFVVIAGSYSTDVDTLAAILCSLTPTA